MISMDQKGQIGFLIIGVLLVVILLPAVIISVFPVAKILFQIFSIFMIYSLVKNYLGPGMISILISGVLIWFLVFKYPTLWATIWFFQLLLGVQILSIVTFGIGMSARR